MSLTFAPARREQVGLLIALAGPSGSGKTYSALRLARGIAPAGKVAFIDTEARRGLHYAGQFDFMHADMRPPFKPAAFIEGIRAAETAGAEVVIIDSFSHEYDGDGGIIDWADELAERGVKSPGNWKDPKMAHKKLMNALLQCRAHIIFCLRADEKIEIVRENGKTAVRPLGWIPICEKRFMYEMTASFTLLASQPGCPNFSLPHKLQDQHRAFFREGEPIGEDAGKAIAAWASGGEVRTVSREAPPEIDTAALIDEGDGIAQGEGMVALGSWWTGLTSDQRKALGPEMLASLKKNAAAAEAKAEAAADSPATTEGSHAEA